MKDYKLRKNIFAACATAFLAALFGCLYSSLYYYITLMAISWVVLSISFILILFQMLDLFEFLNKCLNYISKIQSNYHDIKSSSEPGQAETLDKSAKFAQSVLDINLFDLKDDDHRNHIIICKGYNSAIDCSLFLHKQGYKWSSGDSYTDNVGWLTDENYIGYLFNQGTFIRFNYFNEVNWDRYYVHFWLDKPEG